MAISGKYCIYKKGVCPLGLGEGFYIGTMKIEITLTKTVDHFLKANTV